ncbi:sperm-associated antigen 16 protein-like, partial [Brachyistius frenatus]|uniref:sperm-associated antigen 16 protein-like n=1 Tax=Brachyistius frenatus TaxID=100188 RepID=UPI0037E819D0
MSTRRERRAEEEVKESVSEEEEEERRSAEEEDLEEAVRAAASSTSSRRRPGLPKQRIIVHVPEAVDDFFRNFLLRSGLIRTLNSFETEWYGSAQTLLTTTTTTTTAAAAAGVSFTPDALTHRQLLQNELDSVRRETQLLRQEVHAAGEVLVRVQRERDFHRLQTRRVAEDKNRLIHDYKQLKKLLESYEPALRHLEDKYQAALRQKMLLSLEKERVQNTTDRKLNLEKAQEKKERSIKRSNSGDRSATSSGRHLKDSDFPVCSRLVNPHRAQIKPPPGKSRTSFSLSRSIKGHTLPISCIDLHPGKLILASASDDCSWRLWALPAGER